MTIQNYNNLVDYSKNNKTLKFLMVLPEVLENVWAGRKKRKIF